MRNSEEAMRAQAALNQQISTLAEQSLASAALQQTEKSLYQLAQQNESSLFGSLLGQLGNAASYTNSLGSGLTSNIYNYYPVTRVATQFDWPQPPAPAPVQKPKPKLEIVEVCKRVIVLED